MSMYPSEHKDFTRFYNGKIQHEKEETLIGQGFSQLRRKVEDRNSSISHVHYFMIATKKYSKGHTQQASLDGNIMYLMAKA